MTFITALSAIGKLWKEPKCPHIDEWIKNMWYTYTAAYYLTIKKSGILLFVLTWVELDGRGSSILIIFA